MDASGADKLILLVQTNQVLYDKSTAENKVKDAIKKGDIGRLVLRLVSIVRVLLIYYAISRFSFLVSRFSFLGGGLTGP